RLHGNADEAGIGLALADVDVAQRVAAAVGDDLVQHLGEDQRIDNVALEDDHLHKLRGRGRIGGWLSHDAAPGLAGRSDAGIAHCKADMCRLLLSGLEMPPLRSTSANKALAVSGKLLSWMVRTVASTSYSARFSSPRWSSMTAYEARGSPSRGWPTLPAL